MEDSTIWWLMAGGLVVTELLTGSFYLLMIALGAAAAALAAHGGLPMPQQIVAAALVGGGAVVAWHFVNSKRAAARLAQGHSDINLDVGETLLIEHWGPDGTTTVKYRGAAWTAMHRPGTTPRTGMHRVAELVGNRLLVDPI